MTKHSVSAEKKNEVLEYFVRNFWGGLSLGEKFLATQIIKNGEFSALLPPGVPYDPEHKLDTGWALRLPDAHP